MILLNLDHIQKISTNGACFLNFLFRLLDPFNLAKDVYI
jgi:hypothetical protein